MTTTSTTATPCGDEAELYRRHQRDLLRAVSRAVNAPQELIEDACQNAWAILLRSQPDCVSIFAWLRVVAIHEAYRLSQTERRHTHLEDLGLRTEWEAIIADRSTIDDAIEAREALRALASLPERQRNDLTLLVAGFSYREIGEITGGRTFTNVISSQRCRLRAVAPFHRPRHVVDGAAVGRVSM